MKNFIVSIENDLGKLNKKLVHRIAGIIKKELDLSIISVELNLISDNSIKIINKKYLKHDYFTDVISFNYTGNVKNIDGEIFISVDTARINAKKYRCTTEKEIIRLIVHGFLHLAGYDDKTILLRRKMKKEENNLVKLLFPLTKNDILLYDNKIC